MPNHDRFQTVPAALLNFQNERGTERDPKIKLHEVIAVLVSKYSCVTCGEIPVFLSQLLVLHISKFTTGN